MKPSCANQDIPDNSTNIMNAYIFALCVTMLSTALVWLRKMGTSFTSMKKGLKYLWNFIVEEKNKAIYFYASNYRFAR